jgi:GAF domain
MPITGIENLPVPLARAEARYRYAAAQLAPAGREMLARRVQHFASSLRFGLEQPAAMRRLHEVSKDLGTLPRFSALLGKVLEGALSLTGADYGNIQIIDPATGSLSIVTQAGFGPDFLDYFAVVDDEGCACGRAAKNGAQVVVDDVYTDPGFAPHREIAAASGFRAVQSTPLADYAGRLVGMVSTHFQRPHRPSGRDLRVLELYGDFAGAAAARHLGISSEHGPGDPVGRAVTSGLARQGPGRAATMSVPFELWVMGQMTASLAQHQPG